MIHCAFCGASNFDVDVMVQGQTAAICGQCIETCRDIVGAHRIDVQDGETKFRTKPKP